MADVTLKAIRPGKLALILPVMMAVCAVPQFVFSLFSLFGWCCMRLLHGHRNWGKLQAMSDAEFAELELYPDFDQ